MSLSFRVKNLDETMAFLETRGGTFLSDPVEDKDARGGTLPRRRDRDAARRRGVPLRRAQRLPRLRARLRRLGRRATRASPDNVFGIQIVDHVTSNGLTMQPIIAWYRDVLGFEPFWEIKFHTKDVAAAVRATARASSRS